MWGRKQQAQDTLLGNGADVPSQFDQLQIRRIYSSTFNVDLCPRAHAHDYVESFPLSLRRPASAMILLIHNSLIFFDPLKFDCFSFDLSCPWISSFCGISGASDCVSKAGSGSNMHHNPCFNASWDLKSRNHETTLWLPPSDYSQFASIHNDWCWNYNCSPFVIFLPDARWSAGDQAGVYSSTADRWGSRKISPSRFLFIRHVFHVYYLGEIAAQDIDSSFKIRNTLAMESANYF